MTKPLHVTERDFHGHLEEASKVIRAAVDGQPDARLIAVDNTQTIVADLVGSSCERVERNIGQARAQVLPFVPLQDQLWAWLGYQESWALPTGRHRGKTHEFRASSISIFFGIRNDAYKPQVFRSEWAGWAPWNGGNYAFQGGNAGHPHWQFDLLDALQDDAGGERARVLSALKTGAEYMPAKEFAHDVPSVRDLVASQNLSRIHFPSAAAWWRPPPQNRHAFSPESVMEICAWLNNSLGYLRSELVSLTNRRQAS